MSATQGRNWFARIFRRAPRPLEAPLVCRDVVALITSYLEGALPPADHSRVEAHLAVCPNCSRYLAQIRQTIQATGKLAEEDLRPEVKEALLAAFRNWKPD